MIKRELKPMLALAMPVVTAELAWVTMGIVDTIMVGGLGPTAMPHWSVRPGGHTHSSGPRTV